MTQISGVVPGLEVGAPFGPARRSALRLSTSGMRPRSRLRTERLLVWGATAVFRMSV